MRGIESQLRQSTPSFLHLRQRRLFTPRLWLDDLGRKSEVVFDSDKLLDDQCGNEKCFKTRLANRDPQFDPSHIQRSESLRGRAGGLHQREDVALLNPIQDVKRAAGATTTRSSLSSPSVASHRSPVGPRFRLCVEGRPSRCALDPVLRPPAS